MGKTALLLPGSCIAYPHSFASRFPDETGGRLWAAQHCSARNVDSDKSPIRGIREIFGSCIFKDLNHGWLDNHG